MTHYKIRFLVTVLICTCLTGISQTVKTVDSLENQYHECLDKGEFMLGCSQKFYIQMDSLLNVQYKKLKTQCDSVQSANLKADLLKWLAIRDKQFEYNKQQVHKEALEGAYKGGQDETMILTDKNALFLRDRVIELSNKIPDSYSSDQYKSRVYKISTD